MKAPLTLSGFNNLSKILSLNLYEFRLTDCSRKNSNEEQGYYSYIHHKFGAQVLSNIIVNICKKIDAQILSSSIQDYSPTGASSMYLLANSSAHLDKSHISIHTYPEINARDGIHGIRLGLDIASCGTIGPLKIIHDLVNMFDPDIMFMDYTIRGHTKRSDGANVYNDTDIACLSEFMDTEQLTRYPIKEESHFEDFRYWHSKFIHTLRKEEDYFLFPNQTTNSSQLQKLKEHLDSIYANKN